MWVTDEAAQDFFEGAVLRAETLKVYKPGVDEAYAILSADEKRMYLGAVTGGKGGWTAWLRAEKKSFQVKSFAAAVQLIELSYSAPWKEGPSGYSSRERVYRVEEA